VVYHLDPDEPIAGGVVGIARDQTAAAWRAIEEDGLTAATVHDVRKRCKKVRGLIRLVRPSLGELYGPANVAYREAAQLLSGTRDADAQRATFDRVLVAAGRIDDQRMAPVRNHLRARAEQRGGVPAELAEHAAERLGEGLETIECWSGPAGWEAVEGGPRRVYRRARAGFEAAVEAPRPEVFHEWRKRLKYLWYHTRLLQVVSPSALRPLRRSFHATSDALGDAHDLAGVAAVLRRLRDDDGDDATEAAIVLCEGYRSELERRALALGARLHVESPKRFEQRLAGYWCAWSRYGPEQRVGEIDVLAP
jgi:CHAD domain-containing protein